MGREVITRYISDLSGQDIPDGKGIVVTIKYEEDPTKPWYQLDVSEDEITELLSKAREVPKRGRQKKAA